MSYIVIYDDEQGHTCPMGWNSDCEGAIECFSGHVAEFPTRAAARKSINISRCLAHLNKSQGIPENLDFTTGYRNLKIIPLKPAPKAAKTGGVK